MTQVIWISLLSGLATGIGGLMVVWFGKPGENILAFYLGISAGMMGMVVLADLIPASLAYGGLFYTFLGIILGIGMMVFFQWIITATGKQRKYRQMGYFMTMAIALHNIPEGLAIGAGYESQVELGIRVALVIALHNIPEGLGVASTLYLGRLSPILIVLLPLSTGLFIPIGTFISVLISDIIPGWIAIGLSIASGAMGYLVIKEIGPESMRLHRLLGQVGIASGILILYIVNNLH